MGTCKQNMISATKVVGLSLVMTLLLLYEQSVPRTAEHTTLPHIKVIPHHTSYSRKAIHEDEEEQFSEISLAFDGPFDEEACQEMTQNIKVAPDFSMPEMALASFPRCGNSWTRKMLHIATGIYTGSVYEELTGNLSNTVCIKTHEFDTKTIQRFEAGVILLMRNPTLSLISEFFRANKMADPSLTEEDETSMIQDQGRWNHFVTWRVERWRSTNIDWIQNSKRLLIIFYEELTADPSRELAKMVHFLRQPVRPERIRCAVRSNPWINQRHIHFTVYFPKVLENYISDVNETLKSHNFRPLPTYDLSYVDRAS